MQCCKQGLWAHPAMAEPERAAGADGEEEEIVETDPEGRYYRYAEVVGRGRFKQIYKAFDTQIGIDVAWSKICAEPHHLQPAQLHEIVDEMTKGLELEHPNIIKCFKCWEDPEGGCINLITELFTSGNLRQYRNLHKHLDLKAVKRMARQILHGLKYLHGMSPPLMHGDLRCDKIYVNGHSGEIKIGDLGLATLIPLRWEADGGPGPSPECADAVNRHDVRSDIFAFGLCMLELLTLKQLDPQHSGDPLALLREVADDDSKRFIAHCVGPLDELPTAVELLDDPFLQVKKAPLAPADGSMAQLAQHPEPLPTGGARARGRVGGGRRAGAAGARAAAGAWRGCAGSLRGGRQRGRCCCLLRMERRLERAAQAAMRRRPRSAADHSVPQQQGPGCC